jgi:hypothetical protein
MYLKITKKDILYLRNNIQFLSYKKVEQIVRPFLFLLSKPGLTRF